MKKKAAECYIAFTFYAFKTSLTERHSMSDLQNDSSPPFTPDSYSRQAAYLRCQSQAQLSAGKHVG